MKRVYELRGLRCAACAARMEESAARLPGVSACAVNPVTSRLVLETDGNGEQTLLENLRRIIRKIEPGVQVVPL